MDPNIPIDRQDVADEPKTYCDYCGEQTDTEDDESRTVVAGDESIVLCSGCAEHYLD